MKKMIWFDMDGTIADFYGVEGWLDMLEAGDLTPYIVAKPLFNMAIFARILNRLQKWGYGIGIISWTSKSGTDSYNHDVAEVKLAWLKKHLPSVKWNAIYIVPYGCDKYQFAESKNDILFDDEERNRNDWTGKAYNVNNILGILRTF